jgi:glycerophosphoryl diester phosphodiesterase
MSQGSVALLAFTPVWIGRFAQGAVAQVPTRFLGGLVPLVTRRFLRAAHRIGRRVAVWTINDAETMAELLELGVDGIVTDALDVLKDVLITRGLWEGNA